MISRLFVYSLLFFATFSIAQASDLSALYSSEHLQERHDRYEPALRANFNRLVLGSLTREERARLGHVQLKLPLRAPGKEGSNPLSFYAVGNTVVMPIQSIKFFDDLSLAWAYAWSNNLSLENVTDYVSVLKYQKPPADGFPAPLVALGVAPDIWKRDKRVDDVSQKILKSAIVWIMAHEVAHLLFQHPGYGPQVSVQQAQANEAEADRFANEIMRRIGVAPGGMANFFVTLAHWSSNRGDFSSDAKWQAFLKEEATHPFTAARMQALAADLRRDPSSFSIEAQDRQTGKQNVLYIASQIDDIATILNDLGIQRSIAAKAQATKLSALSYTPKKTSTSKDLFSGTFKGSFEHFLSDGSSELLGLTVNLNRQKSHVTGSFDFGLGQGSIEGFISNKQLRFEWSWGANFGQGILNSNATGNQLTGQLGYQAFDHNAGRWQLSRD